MQDASIRLDRLSGDVPLDICGWRSAGAGWIISPVALLPGWPIKARRRRWFLLLHPDFGVAVLDLWAPEDVQPDQSPNSDNLGDDLAMASFLRRQDPRLPVRRVHLALDALPHLGGVLARAFAGVEPLALSGGDAWIVALQSSLMDRREVPAAAPRAAPPNQRRPSRSIRLCGGLAVAGLATVIVLALVEARLGEPAYQRGAAVPQAELAESASAPDDAQRSQPAAPEPRIDEVARLELPTEPQLSQPHPAAPQPTPPEPVAAEAAPSAPLVAGSAPAEPLPEPAALEPAPPALMVAEFAPPAALPRPNAPQLGLLELSVAAAAPVDRLPQPVVLQPVPPAPAFGEFALGEPPPEPVATQPVPPAFVVAEFAPAEPIIAEAAPANARPEPAVPQPMPPESDAPGLALADPPTEPEAPRLTARPPGGDRPAPSNASSVPGPRVQAVRVALQTHPLRAARFQDASPAPRCRDIVLRVQLGEELSHADRGYLRAGCAARR